MRSSVMPLEAPASCAAVIGVVLEAQPVQVVPVHASGRPGNLPQSVLL